MDNFILVVVDSQTVEIICRDYYLGEFYTVLT